LAQWLPRLGLTGLAAAAVFLATQKWQQKEKHEKFAQDISLAAADIATVPNAELLLQDFDAIRELGQVSAVSMAGDDELLRVLQ
jgi:hypothetical protein